MYINTTVLSMHVKPILHLPCLLNINMVFIVYDYTINGIQIYEKAVQK